MRVSELALKLGIQPGDRVLILHPPNGYKAMLEPLPRDALMMLGGAGPFDVVQCFVSSRAEVEQRAPAALAAAAPGAKVWLCFPKKRAGIKTDISRDVGWECVSGAGWRGVSITSIDATWSARRFRPAAEPARNP